jgi:hypothetical protein
MNYGFPLILKLIGNTNLRIGITLITWNGAKKPQARRRCGCWNAHWWVEKGTCAVENRRGPGQRYRARASVALEVSRQGKPQSGSGAQFTISLNGQT